MVLHELYQFCELEEYKKKLEEWVELVEFCELDNLSDLAELD